MPVTYINPYIYGGGNWWDDLSDVVAVYQPKGAASLAASYVNLVNPGTYDAAPGVAPTWATGTGWTFNGSTQYLNSGIGDTATQTFLIRFSGVTLSGDNYIFGSSWLHFSPHLDANGGLRRYHNRFLLNGGASTAAGVAANNQTSGFWNGSSEGNFSGAAQGLGRVLFIGCLNAGTFSPSAFCAGSVQAVAICSSVQSAGQIAAVSTAMAAL